MNVERLEGRTVRLNLESCAFPVPTAAVLRRPEEAVELFGERWPHADQAAPESPLALVSLGPTLLQAALVTRVERRGSVVWVRYRVVPRPRLPWWTRADGEWLELLLEPIDALRLSPYHLVAYGGGRPGDTVRFVREREGTVLGRIERGPSGEVAVVEHAVGALARRPSSEDAVGMRHGTFQGAVADDWRPGGLPGAALALEPPCRRPRGRGRPPRRYRLVEPRAAEALSPHAGTLVRADGLVLSAAGEDALDPDLVTRQDDAWEELYDAGVDRCWGTVESELTAPPAARSVA